MEINRFKSSNANSLDKSRKVITKFTVPKMYYFIEGYELLRYFEINFIRDSIVATYIYKCDK
nr:MAG TPA: hypothetical protein [Caudoviricetes sp.]